ncbi:MAG: hypothetical protein KGI39_00870 [Patescibacteria group bacterium]|nr:hypothetical protein [Patescibacteria group bacterium]
MFGILIATVLGVLECVFNNKNFFECYLSATLFLFWWTVGAGIAAFLLRRILPGKIAKICGIFHLSKMPQRIFLRKEILFSFFALFSVGAAYLLHSSLDGLEGLYYWESRRIVTGISMYCVIVFLNYFDFRKTES